MPPPSEPITAFLRNHPDPYQVIDLGKDMTARLFKVEVIRDWPPELLELLEGFRRVVVRLLKALPPENIFNEIIPGSYPPALSEYWAHPSAVSFRPETLLHVQILRQQFGFLFPDPDVMMKRYCRNLSAGRFQIFFTAEDLRALASTRASLEAVLSAIEARQQALKPPSRAMGPEKRAARLREIKKTEEGEQAAGRRITLQRLKARIQALEREIHVNPDKELREDLDRCQEEAERLKKSL